MWMDVRVYEPRGVCRQKGIGKVHETVTLCPLCQRLSKPSCLCSYPPLPSRLSSFSPPVPSLLPPVPPCFHRGHFSPPSLPLCSSVSPLLISVIPSISFSFCFTPFFSLSFSSSPESVALSFYVFLIFLSFFFFASRNTAFSCHHPILSAFLCSAQSIGEIQVGNHVSFILIPSLQTSVHMFTSHASSSKAVIQSPTQSLSPRHSQAHPV